MKIGEYFILVVIIMVFNSCKDDVKDDYSIHPSRAKQNYDLVKIDSLMFRNTDSQYIGRVRDIAIWKDFILVTDFVFNKIWIFNKKLSLIKTFGQKGRGPGEFISAPLMIFKDSTVVLYDYENMRATVINHSFELLETIQVKRKRIMRPAVPIYMNGNYVFAGGGTSSKLENLFNSGSLVLLDDNFEYFDEILKYDDEYQKRNAFIVYNDFTHMAKGNNNTFFVLQSAARKIFHLNDRFSIENTIKISPKYFKEPPEDDIYTVSKSLEIMGEFWAKITSFKKFDYDKESKHIYIHYVNYLKEMVTERNWLKGEHYLQILDKDYNTVLDVEIDGIFLFVENGKIYILTDENPEGIKINIYNLIEHKNE